jgi:TolB-like protein/class 3 adenylate cyclase/Flp pilus assembly protein TadD
MQVSELSAKLLILAVRNEEQSVAEAGVERRLTTVLAADVVGYSRLMAANEAETLAQLKSHRKELIEPKTSEYHGRVVKLMGDGTLMEFGSVVDAVTFAVEVQRVMAKRNAEVPEDRRIAYRIGINIGDIIVDDEDIYGDGVNVAARLEGLAEPGGICVSRNVFDEVKTKVEVGFEDLGQQEVKNIPEPVQVFKALLDSTASVHMGLPASTGKRLPVWPILAICMAVIIVVTAGTLWLRPWRPSVEPALVENEALPLPERPSVAVLPFNNMSGDAAQEYFSDGITEDLITDLSKVSGLFVIARNSSFAYKGRSVDLRQIGRELGVRYILEGSIRKEGRRVRINAQLIDSFSGGHIWAERFDRDIEDVFALQDEVTQKIVSALSVKLNAKEQQRLSQATEIHPQSYDLFLRGLERLRRFTPQTNVEARDFFHQAMMADPRFARAVSGIGLSYAMDVFLGAKVEREETLLMAERYAMAAKKLDETVPAVHFGISFIYERRKRFDGAVEAARRSVELDTNYADGYAQLASALIQAGRPQEGLEAIQTAMRLNPARPFFYLDVFGRANFMLGRFDEAAMIYEEVVHTNPGFISGHRGLAAAYAYLGRIEDAEWEGEEILVLQPDFSLRQERVSSAFKRKEDMERYIEGLRKAGLPP